MPPEIGGGPVSHQQIYAVSNYAGKPRAILTVAASPRSHVLARARVEPVSCASFETRLRDRELVKKRGSGTHIVRDDGRDLIWTEIPHLGFHESAQLCARQARYVFRG